MADLVLPNGQIVLVDDEDLAWAQTLPWRAWRRYPDDDPILVSDEYRDGRTFRRRLHREIAVRANPTLAKSVDRLRVTFRNGDPFDVRRENLSTSVRPLRRGRPKRDARPQGYVLPRKKNPQYGRSGNRNTSQLWNPTLGR